MDLALGDADRFGSYEVIRRLGRGGSADVFEARHVDRGQRVALKVVRTVISGDREALLRVVREARAAMVMNHPHIVQVFDAGTENRIPYIVMELLEGEDLARRLTRDVRLSVQESVDMLLPVISGACTAHAAGCIHRDLKPSNIFLARRGDSIEPVIVDFGISKFIDSPLADGSVSGVIAGTPRYMAPEQIRGLAPSPMIDQYALGVVVYECTTGLTPFRSEDRYELQIAIMTAPLAPPSELNSELSTDFDRVVLRALARDPSARFPSLLALGEALLPFASEQAREKWIREFIGRPFSKEKHRTSSTPPTSRFSSGYHAVVSSLESADDTELASRRSVDLSLAPGVMLFDGVAAIVRGDTLTMLWNAPARTHRSQWVFDIADRLAQNSRNGFLSLMILLPSASPPDEAARRENRRRMGQLATSTRCWVSVVVGDDLFQMITRAILRTMGKFYLLAPETKVVSTVSEGIARLREAAGAETPSATLMDEDIGALCSALAVRRSDLRWSKNPPRLRDP